MKNTEDLNKKPEKLSEGNTDKVAGGGVKNKNLKTYIFYCEKCDSLWEKTTVSQAREKCPKCEDYRYVLYNDKTI